MFCLEVIVNLQGSLNSFTVAYERSSIQYLMFTHKHTYLHDYIHLFEYDGTSRTGGYTRPTQNEHLSLHMI